MISKESYCELNAVIPHKIAYAILIRGVAVPGAKAPYDVMPNDFNNWGNRLATAGAGHPAGVPPGKAWPVYDDDMGASGKKASGCRRAEGARTPTQIRVTPLTSMLQSRSGGEGRRFHFRETGVYVQHLDRRQFCLIMIVGCH